MQQGDKYATGKGAFQCFAKIDDKLVNVCKLEELEAQKNAPPPEPVVEKEVDMDSIRAARIGAAERKRDIKLRERPEWL